MFTFKTHLADVVNLHQAFARLWVLWKMNNGEQIRPE